MRRIPAGEIELTFARSGGAGGQNVNKRETKAVLRWKVGTSSVFSDAEKDRIRAKVSLTDGDEVVLHCDEERLQAQNRIRCVNRLHDLVAAAIKVQAKRVPTKKGKGVRRRELDSKTREGAKKRARRTVDFDGRIG